MDLSSGIQIRTRHGIIHNIKKSNPIGQNIKSGNQKPNPIGRNDMYIKNGGIMILISPGLLQLKFRLFPIGSVHLSDLEAHPLLQNQILRQAGLASF